MAILGSHEDANQNFPRGSVFSASQKFVYSDSQHFSSISSLKIFLQILMCELCLAERALSSAGELELYGFLFEELFAFSSATFDCNWLMSHRRCYWTGVSFELALKY
jgi:hypothetical protein